MNPLNPLVDPVDQHFLKHKWRLTSNGWIRREQTQGRWYVSCSFGVDSWVAYSLATEVHPQVPIVWVNQGWLAEWPDCLALQRWTAAQGIEVVEVTPDIDLSAWYALKGMPIAQSMDNAEDKHLNELQFSPVSAISTSENNP